MSHQIRSATERVATLIFVAVIASLIWIVQSHASKTPKVVTEQPLETQKPTPNPRQRSAPKGGHKCPECAPAGNQYIYTPLVDLPESSGGELVFNSRSPQTMSVTPIFYKTNGEAVTADPVQINSAEIRYVNIKDLLPEQYRNHRDWGGFALAYYGVNREMWSQFRFLGINGGQNIDEFFTVKEESRADRYEAVWWTPDKSEAIVALGNISDTATSATLSFGDGHTRSVNLRPHATEIIRDEQRNGGPRSVVITVTGAAGSIVPTGLISAKNGSFNSVIRFYAPGAAKQPNLYANGFRVKGVTPHLILKNTTSNSVAVLPRFTPLNGKDPFELPQVGLAPNETREVDLSDLLRASQHRANLDVVSVEVTNWAAPGSVIGALYSTGNEDGTNYDTPLRDSGQLRTMTGSYPWKVENGFSTLAYITNISSEPAVFVGEMSSQGTHVLIEERTLAAGETAVFDLRKIRDEQKPDRWGHSLPADASVGQLKWAIRSSTKGKVVLIGREEMVSNRNSISTSYSCNDPCPPYMDWWVNPLVDFMAVGESGNTAAWYNVVYDGGYWSGPFGAGAGWSLDSTAASVDPTSAQGTTVYAEDADGAEGDVTLTADLGFQDHFGWDGLNCYYTYTENMVSEMAFKVAGFSDATMVEGIEYPDNTADFYTISPCNVTCKLSGTINLPRGCSVNHLAYKVRRQYWYRSAFGRQCVDVLGYGVSYNGFCIFAPECADRIILGP